MQKYQQESYDQGHQEAKQEIEFALSRAEDKFFYRKGFNQGITDSIKGCTIIAEDLGGEELKSLFLKELDELKLGLEV